MTTIGSIRNTIIQAALKHYTESEAVEIASILLEETLEIPRHKLSLLLKEQANEKITEALPNWIKALDINTPYQYILGHTYFLGNKICVNQDVLIPRPETEKLLLETVKRLPKSAKTFADFCTGSGCIALGLRHFYPHALIYACDISEKALFTAKVNEKLWFNTLGINWEKVNVLTENFITPKLDLVISNPPYILPEEAIKMHDNVLKHEPNIALFVTDNNPLQFYKPIATMAFRKLNKNGLIVFECNDKYTDIIKNTLEEIGFVDLEIMLYADERPRMVFGRKA